MNDPNSSSFLVVNGVYSMELWSKRKVRHVNGTCKCYKRDATGKVTGGSGDDCEYSCLSGKQQGWVK